jgi:DNA-binding winged helix-turn-helix (wHTH) protein
MANAVRQFYEFGPYRIDPDHRQLTRESKPVPLQPKAFDLLLVLVLNSERLVPKDDLMKALWPGTFVEESNLAQNISVLRKTLGDTVGENRYVLTVPGRGYRFAEKVPTGSSLRYQQAEAQAFRGKFGQADRQIIEPGKHRDYIDSYSWASPNTTYAPSRMPTRRSKCTRSKTRMHLDPAPARHYQRQP